MKLFRNSASWLVAIALIASIGFAAIKTANAATGSGKISYIIPTQYADGTAMPLSDILQYNIQCKFKAKGATSTTDCVGLTPTFFSGPDTGGTVTITIPATGGDVCFSLNTQTIGGAVSPWSPTTSASCKTFTSLAPNAPGNVTFTVTVAVSVTQ